MTFCSFIHFPCVLAYSAPSHRIGTLHQAGKCMRHPLRPGYPECHDRHNPVEGCAGARAADHGSRRAGTHRACGVQEKIRVLAPRRACSHRSERHILCETRQGASVGRCLKRSPARPRRAATLSWRYKILRKQEVYEYENRHSRLRIELRLPRELLP